MLPERGSRPVAQSVLMDSAGQPESRVGARAGVFITQHGNVVDLAWLRVTPWRERVAAHYDPADRFGELGALAKVVGPPRARTRACPALLLLGWLADRLGWRCEQLNRDGDLWRGRARERRGEVELRLEPVARMHVPAWTASRSARTSARSWRSSAARAG